MAIQVPRYKTLAATDINSFDLAIANAVETGWMIKVDSLCVCPHSDNSGHGVQYTILAYLPYGATLKAEHSSQGREQDNAVQ